MGEGAPAGMLSGIKSLAEGLNYRWGTVTTEASGWA